MEAEAVTLPPADVLVVGSGAAGMAAALVLAPLRVAGLTKTHTLVGGASPWAQGGVAAAVGSDDDTGRHARDAIAAAGGLADPEIVNAMVSDGPGTIARLIRLGARVDRDDVGRLVLCRRGRALASSRRKGRRRRRRGRNRSGAVGRRHGNAHD